MASPSAPRTARSHGCFFLICCKDDRTHLHVLARLAQMLHEPAAVAEMLAAADSEQLTGTLHRRELAVLGKG